MNYASLVVEISNSEKTRIERHFHASSNSIQATAFSLSLPKR